MTKRSNSPGASQAWPATALLGAALSGCASGPIREPVPDSLYVADDVIEFTKNVQGLGVNKLTKMMTNDLIKQSFAEDGYRTFKAKLCSAHEAVADVDGVYQLYANYCKSKTGQMREGICHSTSASPVSVHFSIRLEGRYPDNCGPSEKIWLTGSYPLPRMQDDSEYRRWLKLGRRY